MEKPNNKPASSFTNYLWSWLKPTTTSSENNLTFYRPKVANSKVAIEAEQMEVAFPGRTFKTILSDEDSKSSKLRVLQYNILADCYCSLGDRYTYCPEWGLHWNYRKRNLKKEILSYEADIIALQEYENGCDLELEMNGYTKIYQQRPGHFNGCATFYKSNKLKVIKSITVNYNDTEPPYNTDPTSLIESLKHKKDNIAIITIVEVISTGYLFCFANTHLHWDPNFSYVKVAQGYALLESIKNVLKSYDDIPLIICGDFNSLVESGVYELYSKGMMPSDHIDLKEYKNKNSNPTIMNPIGSLSSVYKLIDEPLSNITSHFSGTLDYIWYTEKNLKVVQLLEPPSNDEIKKSVAIPSIYYSSDHLALCCDFLIN